MLDAFYIYTHHQLRNGGNIHVLCVEVNDAFGLDIHADHKFVPVEFTGAVTTVLLYVSLNINSMYTDRASLLIKNRLLLL